jgi:hypothetical protein
MELIKPSNNCDITVTQSLDYTDGNGIKFTVARDGAVLSEGNVVTVAKWICAASVGNQHKIPSKFAAKFASMALESL